MHSARRRQLGVKLVLAARYSQGFPIDETLLVTVRGIDCTVDTASSTSSSIACTIDTANDPTDNTAVITIDGVQSAWWDVARQEAFDSAAEIPAQIASVSCSESCTALEGDQSITVVVGTCSLLQQRARVGSQHAATQPPIGRLLGRVAHRARVAPFGLLAMTPAAFPSWPITCPSQGRNFGTTTGTLVVFGRTCASLDWQSGTTVVCSTLDMSTRLNSKVGLGAQGSDDWAWYSVGDTLSFPVAESASSSVSIGNLGCGSSGCFAEDDGERRLTITVGVLGQCPAPRAPDGGSWGAKVAQSALPLSLAVPAVFAACQGPHFPAWGLSLSAGLWVWAQDGR